MKIAPLPASELTCDRYSVTINGQPAPVSAARVSAINYNIDWPGHQRPLDQTEIAGFVRCESNDPIEVYVTVNDTVHDVCIRPLSRGISVSQTGNVLTFQLPGPGQYVLEPNDFHRALHIFVSPENLLPELGPNDLYYGPGEHEIGIVELTSNQTVVIDAGAVVYGGFRAFGAKNITITGTGILDGSREIRTSDTQLIPGLMIHSLPSENDSYFLDNNRLRAYLEEHQVLNGCVRLYNCQNCVIEHVTFRDSSSFTITPAACDNILIDDVKLIGMWRYNSDGVDYFNSTNCVLRNSFLRNYDDCVVLKGIGGWGHRSLENIITENCVVWCDWGRNLEIGAETNAKEYSNILFRNCDLIHANWMYLDIQHHNDAYIHDVTFEDIRCEYTRHQQALKFQASDDLAYEDAETYLEIPILLGAYFCDSGRYGVRHSGQKMERICFRNIQVLSDEEIPMQPCQFIGMDEINHVENVIVENLTRNGVRLTDPESANMTWNEYAWNITLK